MQVSVEKSGELERKLTVHVPEERIAERMEVRLSEVGRTARLDGFRPGKIPRAVIKRRFGGQVREEILNDLMRTSFSDALDQEELRPVGEPKIEPGDVTPGAGLSYTATFEIYPSVELQPLEGLQVDKPVCEISESDLDKMIETLREQHKSWTDVDRVSQNGDQLTIDFEGQVDGEVFEGGTAEDFEIELGLGRMIDGFEEGLLARKAGDEVVLDLRFPEKYQAEHLAGKEATFKINVKKVAEPTLPELDDEFFKKFGVEEGGTEAFRTEVRQNMERERDRALQRKFNADTLDRLAEAHDFALPAALIASETQRMQQQALQTMMQRGGNPGGMDFEKFGEMFSEPAQKRVKLGLVVAEMIKQAGITADPAKVRGMIESMASSYEDSAAVVKWYYEDPQRFTRNRSAVSGGRGGRLDRWPGERQ